MVVNTVLNIVHPLESELEQSTLSYFR